MRAAPHTLDRSRRTAAAAAAWTLETPGAVLGAAARRVAYALGLAGRGSEERFFVFVWLTALAGLVLAVRAPSVDALVFVPATIAACHLLVMAAVGNFTYGYRLVYPLYPMLVPYAALVLARCAVAVGGVVPVAVRSFAGTTRR
jgi:hypothetical protein